MDKKRILILGAGISGLSAAWYLSEVAKDYEILVLEKAQRSGGWMETDTEKGFLFEKGPRIFKTSRSGVLLELIENLGLSEEIIASSKEAHFRYIWWKGKLRKFPSHPLSFLFSPLTRPFALSLLGEWRKPPLAAYDESIWDFAVRRFNVETAERVFDPLIMGIYTGDIHKLSIRSCLGFLKNWEENFGSVTSGFWHSLKAKKKKKSENTKLDSNSLFSFKKGTRVLTEALIEQSKAKIVYGQEVKHIHFSDKEVVVQTQDQEWRADRVFCALPVRDTVSLFQDEEIVDILQTIPTESITSVSIGFHKDVLHYKGFGYLIPSTERLNILGAVFDSQIFPQQSQQNLETRLTIKIRGDGLSEGEIVNDINIVLKDHLHIQDRPDVITIKRASDALPQFLVGHGDRIAFLERKMKSKFPRCYLLGNYLSGISVNDCIQRSKETVEEWMVEEKI